ncbi:MAG: hypothetical protein HC906_15540 [Bacteroidales bacterium]|nr:hypothetical protein [Bacteroidales bacterium]
MLKVKNTTHWLNTKNAHTLSAFVYPSWHPGLNFIAFSTNKINQDFYGGGHRLNYVRDIASDIVIYDVERNTIFTSPEIATKDFENLPNWSPDGKYLYFTKCSRDLRTIHDTLVKYDLYRVSFDPQTKEIGHAETLLTSNETNKSISFPEVSPDGRFLVFCMADYGYFVVGNPTSDLYIMDLKTKMYKKLDVNSEHTESFHSWSKEGRWLVFASKRIDGLITHPFFTYIDSLGNASKPFILPQEYPSTIKTKLFNYNRPVFVQNGLSLSQEEIINTTQIKPTDVQFDTLSVDVDAIAGPTKMEKPADEGIPYLAK